MINTRQLALVLLALMAGATQLQAQSEAPGNADSPSVSATDGATDKTAATQQAPAPSEPAPKSSSAASSSKSPFDYRSSEKISEDVPVSFPVDI